ARIRLRERPARDGPASPGARLVAVFVQRRGRNRPINGRPGGRRGPCGPSHAQRDGVADGGGGRLGGRDPRRHILVRSASILLRGRVMKRAIVLGGIVGVWALSLTASGRQAPQGA